MDIKLFQHFHIHNKLEKQSFDHKQQDNNIEATLSLEDIEKKTTLPKKALTEF